MSMALDLAAAAVGKGESAANSYLQIDYLYTLSYCTVRLCVSPGWFGFPQKGKLV